MKILYDLDINGPVDRVYEYYTNPDNIKQAWPRDIVKELRIPYLVLKMR